MGWMLAVVAASSSSPLKTYEMYHALTGTTTDSSFIPRGTISLSSSDLDVVATVSHNDKAEEYLLTLDGNALQSSFYQIKVVDPETQQSALASVPACHMRRSNLREEMTLTLGQSGSLLSVSLTPLISPLALPCEAIQAASDKISFQTVISLSTAQTGMTIPLVLPSVRPPPGYSWFPRTTTGNTNPAIQEQEAQGQQQSFLRKYWYIILPIMLTTVLGNSAEEEPATQAQQPKGDAAAATRVATVTSAPLPSSSQTGSTSQRQRRGKRG